MIAEHPLMPHQSTVARAVVESVLRVRGLTFTVEIARQGGAREVSAQIELLLLELHAHAGARLVKVAPTLDASGMDRLVQLLQAGSTEGLWSQEEHSVRMGRARQLFVGPGSVPALQGPVDLLEVAEAQALDQARLQRHLLPLARASGATTVLYGFPWNGATAFEQAKEESRRLERRDGLQRHFRVPWEEVARHNPLYAQHVAQERSRRGEDHPWFQSRYCLRPVPASGPLFSEAQARRLQGSHRRRRSPEEGKSYVAAVHVASRLRRFDPSGPIALPNLGGTVVTTIAEVDPAGPLRVVEHRWWRYQGLTSLVSPLVEVLDRQWHCQRVVMDVPQDQQEALPLLRRAFGDSLVELSSALPKQESDLGLSLLASANTGRLTVYAADDLLEHRALRYAVASTTANYPTDGTLTVEPPALEEGFLRGLLLLMGAAAPGESHGFRSLPIAVAS